MVDYFRIVAQKTCPVDTQTSQKLEITLAKTRMLC